MYSAKRGQAVYEANRARSRKPHKQMRCRKFISWVIQQMKKHKWSFDACVGYARHNHLFREDEMLSTKTLYNELHAGNLDLTLFDVPDVLKRRRRMQTVRKNKRLQGRSIEDRPAIVSNRTEFGH